MHSFDVLYIKYVSLGDGNEEQFSFESIVGNIGGKNLVAMGWF